jgi:prenylated cyclic peptide (anacyclamide/piricyclamide family)
MIALWLLLSNLTLFAIDKKIFQINNNLKASSINQKEQSMKKRNLKPTQTAPVERPQAGSTSRDPLAMFAAGGVGASGWYGKEAIIPFAGDDAE